MTGLSYTIHLLVYFQASVVASMPTVTESEQLERITQLSSQLSESKHRETELSSGMKDLREQIKELEAVGWWFKTS